ncbi:TPA: hypothetical protein ACNOHR_005088 [Enterobacter hormaechei]
MKKNSKLTVMVGISGIPGAKKGMFLVPLRWGWVYVGQNDEI